MAAVRIKQVSAYIVEGDNNYFYRKIIFFYAIDSYENIIRAVDNLTLA